MRVKNNKGIKMSLSGKLVIFIVTFYFMLFFGLGSLFIAFIRKLIMEIINSYSIVL